MATLSTYPIGFDLRHRNSAEEQVTRRALTRFRRSVGRSRPAGRPDKPDAIREPPGRAASRPRGGQGPLPYEGRQRLAAL